MKKRIAITIVGCNFVICAEHTVIYNNTKRISDATILIYLDKSLVLSGVTSIFEI